VTFESAHEAYSPGDGPWTILPADEAVAAEIAACLAGWTPVGRRFEGQMAAFHAALVAGAPPPVTTADARRSLELVTAVYHSADGMLPIGAGHEKYASWLPDA
jgi:predicted dehydrogenase